MKYATIWQAALVWGAAIGMAVATPPESVGPHSEEEAELLLRDSREAFTAGRMDDAVRILERLVHRYPAHPEMAKSQLLLGRVRIETGQSKKAIAPLLRAVEAWGNHPDGIAARVSLGRAYVGAGDPRAALVAISELTRGPAGKKASPEVIWEGLLVQSAAHLALRKEKEALRDLHSVETAFAAADKAESPVPNDLRAEFFWLKLEMKKRECARLPAPGPMDEAQARVQIERRGACLQEATSIALKTVDPDPERWAPKTAALLAEVVEGFQQTCRNPPKPRGKRSQAQLKRYREELIHHLEPLCERAIQQAFTTIPEVHSLRKAFGSWAQQKK